MSRFSEIKKEPIVFALIQISYWSSICVFNGFMVTYLQGNGFSEFISGLATSLCALSIMLLQPVLGYVADTFVPIKKLLIVSFLLAAPLTLLVPLSSASGVLVLLSFVVVCMFDYPHYTLFDSWIIQLSVTKPYIDYGAVRALGNIGWGFTALIAGQMIADHGYGVMFYGHILFSLLSVGLMLLIEGVPCRNKQQPDPEADGPQAAPAKESLSILQAIGLLIKNREYVRFIISGALMQVGIRAAITFLPVLVENAGGTAAHYGAATFISSMGEMAFMFVASFLINHGIKKPTLFMVALVFAMARMVVVWFDVPLWLLMASQLFQSVFFGLYSRMQIPYVIEITPSNLSSTAATLFGALTFGAGSVFGNLMHGMVMNSLGIRASITISIVSIAVGILNFAPKIAAQRREEQAIAGTKN